ncbi:OmpH family outer membrane protein [bacterium]|nr:OmpH family outer membrane protein [bacterium]
MKKAAIFLSLLVAFFGVNLMADAQTIGYLDFQKVESEYNYAKRAYKELDNKALELQQYIIDKDKQFKAIESPVQKKNFEEKTQAEFKLKEESLYKLKMQKEDEIYNNIMNASKVVASNKKIDIVLDYRVVFTGGVDITKDIIQYLNNQQK